MLVENSSEDRVEERVEYDNCAWKDLGGLYSVYR